MRKDATRKAVSTVIATVILVACAITVAVAAAYWMGGISGQYTKFEKVEISTAYATKSASGWLITLDVKNSGTADSTITTVFINDRPLNASGYGASTFPSGNQGERTATSIAAAGTTLESGASMTVLVWIYNDGTNGYSSLTSGTTVSVKLHSAGGMDYVKLVELI